MKKAILALLIIFSIFNAKASRATWFVNYQVENGLSHNTVWCVLQDSYDFLWFGTSDGLNCFDGKNFRIFRSNSQDKNAIGNNFIQSLFEDEHRNLWVGTNKGLYYFNRQTESFSFFAEKTEDGVLISSSVSKIVKSTNGNIWFATLGQGVFIYNPNTKKLIQNSTYSSFVVSLLAVPTGNVFASSRQDGLICFDKNGKYLRSYIPTNDKSPDSNIEINAMCFHNNSVWFNAGTYGFYKLNLQNNTVKPVTENSNSSVVSNVRSIFPFSDKQLWVGGDNGLYQFDINSETFIRIDDPSNPKSLTDQSVYDIARDREGGMWVSTYFGGVNYLPKNSKPFEHYYPQYQAGSISGKAISQFCEDEAGNLWIATEDGGLNYFNTKTQQSAIYKPAGAKNSLSYHNIHSLMLDGDQLWIGTFSRGIDVFDLKKRSFKNYQHRRNDTKTICDNAVYAILKTSQKEIFAGTAWGLSKYDPNSDSFSMVDELGPYVHIFDIMEDSRGYLWVATYNAGVFRMNLKTKKWDHFTHNPNDSQSVVGNSVISLFEDNRRTVWMGTEGSGMCSFDYKTDKFNTFDPENKILPNPVVYAIEQDEFSNFWIACNAGLVRINPYTKKNRLVFTKSDGLQSNQFNFRSSIRTRDGKMYFGGINGFNSFYPKDFTQNNYIPKVRVVDFKLFNKKVNVTDEDSPLSAAIYELDHLKLKYYQNTFSFTFAALSYQSPEKNQYRYMLEGVDKTWNDVENGNNTASYSNLSSGNYVLKVKGSNNDGIWNKNEVVLQITIKPPFWKTGVAYFLYFILALIASYWLYRRWLKRLSKANEERIKGYREKQEKESYLSKINFFTNISHEIRTPLSLIKLPLERIISSGDGNEATKGFLASIDKNTDYLLNLINQLLDFRKTEESEYNLHVKPCNLNNLLLDLHARFKDVAELKNLEFEICLPHEETTLNIDREAFNKIISNLLSNALKYAYTKISIELIVENDCFEIRISDDGKGITDAEKKKIFDVFYQSDNSEMGTGIGLALAKALVEKHHGTLKLENNQYGGSVFVILVPKSGLQTMDVKSAETLNIHDDSDYNKHLRVDKLCDIKREDMPKVLLVEDNVELIKLTADYLVQYYQVFSALNGREAFDMLAEQNFDVVVSDVMMPEMDGFQLCEAIKSDTQYSHIPIILLTAKTNVEAKITGLEVGSDAYLEKPFSLEHLRKQINNLITSRQRLREMFATSTKLAPVEIAVSQKDKAYIEKLNSEIEKHLLDVNFSIDTLSEFMNMSRSNFYRKIKSISGMSPNDYLKTIRLKKAAELLLSQDYRINEVYEQAGFSSSSYFAKCFKEQFGMLPREFVNKTGKNDKVVDPTKE